MYRFDNSFHLVQNLRRRAENTVKIIRIFAFGQTPFKRHVPSSVCHPVPRRQSLCTLPLLFVQLQFWLIFFEFTAVIFIMSSTSSSSSPCQLDTGDSTWMMLSFILVSFMFPALVLFQAGLLRAKHSLSIVAQVLAGLTSLTLMCVEREMLISMTVTVITDHDTV